MIHIFKFVFFVILKYLLRLFTFVVCLLKLNLNHAAILVTSGLFHLEHIRLIIIREFSAILEIHKIIMPECCASNKQLTLDLEHLFKIIL
jgi:hypothetical protein